MDQCGLGDSPVNLVDRRPRRLPFAVLVNVVMPVTNFILQTSRRAGGPRRRSLGRYAVESRGHF
jgi:hypothetical protein